MKEEGKAAGGLAEGAVMRGKVVRIMPFGAFVEFGGGQSGLVHISEISEDYVKNVTDHVRIGDMVTVKVLGTDEKGRVSLSIKQAAGEIPRKTKENKESKREKRRAAAEAAAKKPVRPAEVDFFGVRDSGLSFEDKLSRFKQVSDENIQVLKRSAESKRSGGYSRRNGNR
ncbi:MAG: S1 RNA-binding domain-containing protein [bacterium]|nr:S1 RNA-binding domain-containing protein [bacterium]